MQAGARRKVNRRMRMFGCSMTVAGCNVRTIFFNLRPCVRTDRPTTSEGDPNALAWTATDSHLLQDVLERGAVELSDLLSEPEENEE